VVERYIRQNLGPDAVLRDAVRTLRVLARFAPRLPQVAEEALTRQTADSSAAPPRRRRWLAAAGYVALGAGAALLGVAAAAAL
jgi:ubiquinone biosynthesis protein